MKTTLGKIWGFGPCCKEDESGGWGLLTKNLGTSNHSKEVDLMEILKSNGIKDAVWALRCFDYLDYCLFLADVAESVLGIYEKKNSSSAPRLAIQAVRDYKAGGITKEKLRSAAADAYAYAAVADAAYAYADAAAADAAVAAAYAYAYAADAAAAAYAADAAAAAYAAAAAAAAYAAARSKKWDEIEQLFIKHFGDK